MSEPSNENLPETGGVDHCDTSNMMATFDEEGLEGMNEEDEDEYDEDTRFLDVCTDGDIEDLVSLLEDMARAGETLGPDMLNCVDSTGRVS